MADGSQMPRDPPDKCLKDRIELYYEGKSRQQLFLNDFDYGPGIISPGPGIISLENRAEPGYSIYTNQVRDPRDDMIQQLLSQQNGLPRVTTNMPTSYQPVQPQVAPSTSYQPYSSQTAPVVAPVSAPAPETFSLAQLDALRQLLNERDKLDQANEERAQFANTRARPGKDSQDF